MTKFRVRLAAISLFLLASSAVVRAGPGPAVDLAQRDGQHDFEFNVGVWRTHITRILNPFSKSAMRSVALDGTVTVRKVWGGRALLEEIEADGPNGHWQGLTLFLYNPRSLQWSQVFANSTTGVPSPPLIGTFQNGRGEFIAQDTLDDRSILVRGVWSDIEANAHTHEESYSDDGGRTWKPAFIANLTRVTP
jgi:hypothetical protein